MGTVSVDGCTGLHYEGVDAGEEGVFEFCEGGIGKGLNEIEYRG